jgi:prolyl 4-hydroxylase
MSKTASNQVPTRLSAEWQDWLASNIVAGCTNADMEKIMVDNAFDPVFARSAIVVVRSMTERVQQQSPSVLNGYVAEPLRLPKGVVLDAAGHAVEVGFSMENPNIALLEGLLTDSECDALVGASAGKLERSLVVDRQSGGQLPSEVRSSEGAHFQRGENDLIRAIEARISALTGLRLEQGEPLQILHYGLKGEYLPHHDYFDPMDPGTAVILKTGGQRIATLVIYLNTPEEGGGTHFPELDLEVKARKGSAVYFEYMNKSGQIDSRSLHAGLPVLKGEKWIATKWLRESNY